MPFPLEPAHTSFGERLRERTQPLAPDDAANGFAHAYLCEAFSRMFREVQEVFDPDDPLPPFAPLLDPQLCPEWALPWLAQWVGTKLPDGVSPADARVIIADVAGFRRGTPAALRAAAQFYLTGTKTVYFRERDQDGADPPYTLQIVTLISETPNPDAVLAALTAQKPGGIILNYGQVETWDYQEMTNRGMTQRWTYSSLPPLYATYADLALDRKKTP